MDPFEPDYFIAKTLFGLEPLLAEELRLLGAKDIEVLRRAVSFKGDKQLMYKANLWLRTALKIIAPFDGFDANSPEEFYDKAKEFDWVSLIGTENTFAIDPTVSGQVFTHSKYISLKLKDAIVDQIREAKGIRPSVNTENPDIRINLHIYENEVTLSLDTSGDSLNRRGYRKDQGMAPLNECLAAAIIMLSGWDKQTTFLDGMTGSGTIAIEAAMIAENRAPGMNRDFTFKRWPSFDPALWNRVRKHVYDSIQPTNTKIIAMDIDRKLLKMAERNAFNADVADIIRFQNRDFFRLDTFPEKLHVMINPPYGERLGSDEDIFGFYKQIGDAFKNSFTDSEAWMLSGNLDAVKVVGLRSKLKIQLFNGALECRLAGYDLYAGSRKKVKPTEDEGVENASGSGEVEEGKDS